MKNIGRVILIISLFVVVGLSAGIARAEEEACNPQALLLQMINDARENPEATLKLYGLDPKQMVKRIPAMADNIKNGMAPLYLVEKLNMAAEAHLADMKANNYYASESLDGRLPYDRLAAQGYLPVAVEESLAMLGFRNFVEPCQAARIIFSNMLRDEWAQTDMAELKILQPGLSDIGISFGTGTIRNGQFVYNYYAAVCDIAANLLSVVETEVVRQVSVARREPVAFAQEAEIDVEELLAENPQYGELLNTSYPAVLEDEVLVETAQVVGEEILSGSAAPDVGLAKERIEAMLAASGKKYDSVVGTYRMMVTVEAVDVMAAAQAHLGRIFARELGVAASERTMLNPGVNRIGLRVISSSPGEWYSDSNNPSGHYNVMLVLLFAHVAD
ncbi:MAG: hypothetical protein HY885_06520 [Deltaproteobacteria bacterium]|nr:hypothetical protein [Deltaproteobacteria bacterium]